MVRGDLLWRRFTIYFSAPSFAHIVVAVHATDYDAFSMHTLRRSAWGWLKGQSHLCLLTPQKIYGLCMHGFSKLCIARFRVYVGPLDDAEVPLYSSAEHQRAVRAHTAEHPLSHRVQHYAFAIGAFIVLAGGSADGHADSFGDCVHSGTLTSPKFAFSCIICVPHVHSAHRERAGMCAVYGKPWTPSSCLVCHGG
jgi:hypothetical protein